MEGTRTAPIFGGVWGVGRLCSRLVTVGATDCRNRPRRVASRPGRPTGQTGERSMEPPQPSARTLRR